MIEVVVKRPEAELTEKIKRERGKDKEVVKVVKEIKKMRVRNLRSNEWEIEEDLVLKEGKVYILKNKKLRIEII